MVLFSIIILNNLKSDIVSNSRWNSKDKANVRFFFIRIKIQETAIFTGKPGKCNREVWGGGGPFCHKGKKEKNRHNDLIVQERKSNYFFSNRCIRGENNFSIKAQTSTCWLKDSFWKVHFVFFCFNKC